MENKLNQIKSEYIIDAKGIKNVSDADLIRVKYLGKKGVITQIMPLLRDVQPEDKAKMGMLINEVKNYIKDDLDNIATKLNEQLIEQDIKNAEKYDITLPSKLQIGSLHPRTIIQKEVEDIFISMGFIVDDGNEVETEFNNFDAVNVPANHPARDMQDTFWLSNGQVLKTHTSAAQNRILKKYKPNVRVIFPGRCFRNEAMDASHENTFFQMEGVIVSENVSVANLIYFMKQMLSKVLKTEVEVRLRPGFFPFTEPSFELDVQCPFCKDAGCASCGGTGWIELCPCGMIHPKVLELAGIDNNKYSGCAFGLGLDRLVMIKSGLSDIRALNSGNLKILKQFKQGI